MKLHKEDLLLYAVTDRSWVGRQTLYEQIEEALLGGATLIQLREKGSSQEELIRVAAQVAQLCHRYGVPLIVNDDGEAAVRSGADGVHVGADDCPVAELRKRFGKDVIIGATAKTLEQAHLAAASGADYLGVGAVFPSPTKRQALPVTHQLLREICAAVDIPVVAIGGINEDNMSELKGSGIAGVAVISALFAAEDIRAAAARLKEQARSVAGEQ